MNHKIKYIVSLFLMIVTVSCGYERTNIKSSFKSEKEIRHTVVELANGEFLSRVLHLDLAGDNLIVDDYNSETFFAIINTNDNTLYRRFGYLGQGPNELMKTPANTTVINDSIMTVFNSNQNSSLFHINYKGDFLPQKKIEFNKNDKVRVVIPVSSTRYISLGHFEEGRYLLLDENGEKLSFNFDYPSTDNNAELSTPMFKFLAFQGELIRKPRGGAFLFAGHDSEIFEIIEIDEDDNLKKVFSYHGEIAQFSPSGDGYTRGSVGKKPGSKIFLINATCSDNYIYLLYSNKVIANDPDNAYRSNNVLVFDWEGNPVTSLLLDIEVNRIAVDENDSYMYAYSDGTEQLVKFEL
jgi:hypothetical protein